MDTRSSEPTVPVEAEAPYPPLTTSVLLCALLALSATVSQIDRQVLSLLVQPIKAQIGLTDFQFSLLQGLAFVMLFSTAGVFMGVLADKISRRNLIMVCLTVWSGATMACGMSSNFMQLFAARAVVGVGQSGLAPSVYSLLCDNFQPKHRGRAFSAYGAAGTFGIACALLGGASAYKWISDNHDAFGALGQTFQPWQLTFLLAGVPGFLLALALLLLVKEPARRASPKRDTTDGASVTRYILGKKRVYFSLFAHFSLYNMAGYAALGWATAHYMRSFGISLYHAGLITGCIVLVGAAGGIMTGFLGDRWIKRRAFAGRLRAGMVSCAMVVPGMLTWFLSDSLVWSVAGGMVAWIGKAVSLTAAPLTIAEITPQQYRGRVGAIYLFCMSVLGVVMGPLVVAAVTDFVFRDESKVNYSLAITSVTAVVLSSICALSVAKRYSTELYGEAGVSSRGGG